MTCEEALKKLYDVIDNEAKEADVIQVQEHLNHCKSCMSRFEFEKMFKHFVVEKGSAPDKTAELKSKILGRIDSIEHGKKGMGGSRFRFGSVMLAVAAGLIICIVAAFSTAKYYRHHSATYPYEQAHMASYPDQFINVQPVSATISSIDQLTGELNVGLNCSCPTLEFVDASGIEINGNFLSQLRCFCKGEYVSFLIGKRDEISLPDFEKLEFAGQIYYHHNCSDCQMIYWFVNDAIIIAICEDVEFDLSELITNVEPI